MTKTMKEMMEKITNLEAEVAYLKSKINTNTMNNIMSPSIQLQPEAKLKTPNKSKDTTQLYNPINFTFF